jgi:hypothetical protein
MTLQSMEVSNASPKPLVWPLGPLIRRNIARVRSEFTHKARRSWAGLILLTAAITVAHFSISPHQMFWHDLLRRAYYIPIAWAVYLSGAKGGVAVSAGVSSVFVVHLLTGWGHHLQSQADQLYEIAGFLAIGLGGGYLVDRAREAAVISAQREWDSELRRLIAASAQDLKSPILVTQELTGSLLNEYHLGTWEHSLGVRLRRVERRLDDVRHDLVGAARILFERSLLIETMPWARQFVSSTHLSGPRGSIRIRTLPEYPPPSHWSVPPAALDELVRCLIDRACGEDYSGGGAELVLSGNGSRLTIEFVVDLGRSSARSVSSLKYGSSKLRDRLVEVLLDRVHGAIESSESGGRGHMRLNLECPKLRISARPRDRSQVALPGAEWA